MKNKRAIEGGGRSCRLESLGRAGNAADLKSAYCWAAFIAPGVNSLKFGWFGQV
jgi:hypothetical protein